MEHLILHDKQQEISNQVLNIKNHVLFILRRFTDPHVRSGLTTAILHALIRDEKSITIVCHNGRQSSKLYRSLRNILDISKDHLLIEENPIGSGSKLEYFIKTKNGEGKTIQFRFESIEDRFMGVVGNSIWFEEPTIKQLVEFCIPRMEMGSNKIILSYTAKSEEEYINIKKVFEAVDEPDKFIIVD